MFASCTEKKKVKEKNDGIEEDNIIFEVKLFNPIGFK